MVYLGELPLALLLGLLGGVGAWELYRLAHRTGVEPLDVPGIAIAGALPLYAALDRLGVLRSPAAIAAVVFLALFALALFSRRIEDRPLATVAITALGAAYAGGTLTFAYLLRHHRFVASAEAGAALVLFPVVVTWASDIGAYFAGRAIGGAKLMPSVSPGKTRAGAWGALVTSAGVAWAYNRYALPHFAQMHLLTLVAVAFGLVVSAVGQVGDLAESMFKREANVKDSSHLLPGHGGVLDRLDSVYFALPVAYLVLDALLRPSPVRT